MSKNKTPRIPLSDCGPQPGRPPVSIEVPGPEANAYSGLIIVEGHDDANFIEHCFPHDFSGYAFFILEGFSRQKLADMKRWYLDLLFKAAERKLTKLALIVDADRDLAARTRELTAFLETLDPALASGYQLGAIRTSSKWGLRIGAFCLPDNKREGELEDLAWPACCRGPDEELVNDYFSKVVEYRKEQSKPELVKMAKRKMQAFLAARQPEPIRGHAVCNGVGYALQHEALTLNDSAPLEPLKNFLTDFLDKEH